MIDDLIDEKGSHEDIFKFACKADIVVCCLSLNRETVKIFASLIVIFILCDSSWNGISYPMQISTFIIFDFQAGIINKYFISSMRKVCFHILVLSSKLNS